MAMHIASRHRLAADEAVVATLRDGTAPGLSNMERAVSAIQD